MINTIVDLDEICFQRKDPGELKESIRRRGLAIPVQCNRTEEGYVCVDGCRRLTALAELSEENPAFKRVEILIMNDFSHAGSGFWGNTLNRH